MQDNPIKVELMSFPCTIEDQGPPHCLYPSVKHLSGVKKALGTKDALLVESNWTLDATHAICKITKNTDPHNPTQYTYKEYFFTSKNEMRDWRLAEPVTQPTKVTYETYEWDLGPQRTHK
jgi:hypothetical protein